MCFSPQRRAIFPHLNFKKWSETVSFLRFWPQNVLLATAACDISTSELQKVLRDRQFFTILTSKCPSRYSGVQFFDIFTSKSGPRLSVFYDFDFKMCFSPQRRAIFRHRNFKKWSAHDMFCTFWLQNVLLATAACNFSTSQLQKAVRPWHVLYILTSKCASRHSGVQFFDIATSKSGPPMTCFVHFDFKMYFSLQRRAIFPHRNFKKWSAHDMFCTFWLQNVLLATAACNFSTSQLQKVVRPWHVLYILTSKCTSRYSGVQFFMSPLNSYLRTRRFTEVTFRSSRHTNHWKTQHFATSLTFRACGSSFYWLSRNCIFFLLTLLLFSAFSSSDSASLLCFFNCPYCRKFDF